MESLTDYIKRNWNPAISETCYNEDPERGDCICQGLDQFCWSCEEWARLSHEWTRAIDCPHTEVEYSRENSNFYCKKCRVGMGQKYFDDHIGEVSRSEPWLCKCLLCHGFESFDLVAVQKHGITDHGIRLADMQKQTKRSPARDYWIYTLPDGRDWMSGQKG